MPRAAQAADTKSKPRSSSRLGRWSVRLLITAVILYLGVCLTLYLAQTRLVFPGSCAPNATSRFTPPAGSTPLLLHTEDGTQIAGLFCRAFDASMQPTSRPADCPTIIYFYGNGQVVAWSLYEIDLFRRCGANVLVADYPGFGLSKGTPTESGCYQTGEALWQYAVQSPEIDPHRIVAVGWSLGGAMAINLAQHHPVQGLMTASAFTRIKPVAQGSFWFVPAKWMLSFEFPSEDRLPSVKCPTLIVHGDADTFVPFAMSHELYRLSPAAWKRHLPIAGAGHNDVFSTGYEPIRAALTELLQQIGQGEGTGAGAAAGQTH